MRSFSTSSVHQASSFLPAGSTAAGLPPAQSRHPVTETLKEHRWSKGLRLNWMPGLGSGGGQQGPGLESRSSQKFVQRRKSEGTGLRISRPDQGPESPSTSEPSLGLAPVSITGKSFSRGIRGGIETSVDQLKVSEARTRRISDSGLSTSSSSRLSGSALAERLSGFAQTVRGLSRSSFSAQGQSSPTMTSNSSCSTPGFSPQYSFEHEPSYRSNNNSTLNCGKLEYDTWDEFLSHYRQGQFPSDSPAPRPKNGSNSLPTPPYVKPCAAKEGLSYFGAPIPPQEEKRLRALYSFQILQTGVDLNFERIVQLVATVMGVSGCIISLVDYDQVSVKAQHPARMGDVPRESSFCGHTILRAVDDPLVILDTHKDWRFRHLPAVVSDPFIRFYAGSPLTTSDGLNIGSLCLIDPTPRTEFSERERQLLIDFAAVVMREMELWNDQVQLCIRNRMMKDVTRWVRGCLDMAKPELNLTADGQDNSARSDEQRINHPLENSQSFPSPADLSTSSSATLTTVSSELMDGPALISPPIEPVFPTPSGSPTLLSCTLGASKTQTTTPKASFSSTGNPLQDRAFPAACTLIQATLNVDAVYLVQASANQSVIPPTGSSIVWNYLDAAGRRKGSVGVVKGGHVMDDIPNTTLVCLASSKKVPGGTGQPVLDDKLQHAKRDGASWVCTDEGCRPHRLGDALLDAVEPVWDRDQPVIREMLQYVRQETPAPTRRPGQHSLFVYSHGEDTFEDGWFGPAPQYVKDPRKRKLLCHTFQGTLPDLSSGKHTPFQSGVIVPILGPITPTGNTITDEEPWAYFVILSSSRTKQFSFHERIYLKNFGSCLVTEVMKRRVETADKAKGTFIKSISHELRTPLHIILGILELLYANPEEPLSENQMAMVNSAEASGKSLIDTINNIIDLAKLDPDNSMDPRNFHGSTTTAPQQNDDDIVLDEIDIRELCEKVAESMAKACTNKNIVVIPSWTKPSLSSLSSAASTAGASGTASSHPNSRMSAATVKGNLGSVSSTEEMAESPIGIATHKLPMERKPILELMVAMDEPDKDPDQDTHWNFLVDVSIVTRILSQLVENAIKFTSSGYVELSAIEVTHNPANLKPPYPEARPILFTVRDTGKGISAEFVQSHLFERFSQEDPLQVGTGLGLALVKELVKKLGGWMEVWSEGVEGKGCVIKVLLWATPANHQTKSLKDMKGPWQEMSCRFYTGEPSVSSDRLFKILGERMMGQQLMLNVERGAEHETRPEEMMRELADHSRCDLLVINDDLMRLKAYLSHWTEYHFACKAEGIVEPVTPVPLLVLCAPPNVKTIQQLVDDYLETQIDSSPIERPATIVIMTKPIGPLKLVQCMRDCFTPACSDQGLQTPQGSPRLSPTPNGNRLPPLPMIRSATVPHITTTTLGVNDNRLLSAGSMIKQSFVFPSLTTSDMVFIPPHSPGGLVLPQRNSHVGQSPATTPECEKGPTHGSSSNSSIDSRLSDPVTPGQQGQHSITGGADLAEFRAKIDANVRKNLQTQRSIRNLHISRPTRQSHATFPITESVATATDSNSLSLPRVLIVEDNITNRMILRTFLKKRGIGVVEAENGKLGVERFQEEVWRRKGKQGFEFVLMDLQMPVMDGNVATKRIREFEQTMVKEHGLFVCTSSLSLTSTEAAESTDSADTATAAATSDRSAQEGCEGYRPTIIFALTGLAADEDKRLAFECGVDGYLTKPVSLKTLGSLLSSCLPADIEGLTVQAPSPA
ncbi:His Kinase A domain containing protein [Gryganskiella cystojenkinii]|nr:His Kinase A domain containing protein [Gryganskiella cystojenkinii]